MQSRAIASKTLHISLTLNACFGRTSSCAHQERRCVCLRTQHPKEACACDRSFCHDLTRSHTALCCCGCCAMMLLQVSWRRANEPSSSTSNSHQPDIDDVKCVMLRSSVCLFLCVCDVVACAQHLNQYRCESAVSQWFPSD